MEVVMHLVKVACLQSQQLMQGQLARIHSLYDVVAGY